MGEKFTCGTWKQATKPQASPSSQRSHNMELFLNDALAASTRTFPPRLLGAAWPDATAALCQTKLLAGVRGSDGNTPQLLPCRAEKIKAMYKTFTAPLARQELQETSQLAMREISRYAAHFLPHFAQQCPHSLWL